MKDDPKREEPPRQAARLINQNNYSVKNTTGRAT